jgi:hypothetical protein
MSFAGRYTGYQYFPDRQFNEATNARAPAYTQPEYQCPHSSRTYQFAFEDTPARQHYDAAVTTCCDSPVRPFDVHPQYEEQDAPMRAQDCARPDRPGACNTFFLKQTGSQGPFKAKNSFTITGNQVGCLAQCQDSFGELASKNSVPGQHGTFSVRGRTQAVAVVDFHGRADLEFFNRCGGTDYRHESVCEDRGRVSWAVRADFGTSYPCDCCNESGGNPFGKPYAKVSWAVPPATWQNEADVGNVRVSETCSGAKLSASFAGSGAVRWSSGPGYHYSGNQARYTEGHLHVGNAGTPACCGGYIGLGWDNGCGDSSSGGASMSGRIQSSALTPVSGTEFVENQSVDFKIDDACSYANDARFWHDGSSCVEENYFGLARYDGYLIGHYTAQTENSSVCRRCCGRGVLRIAGNNGCWDLPTNTYHVRYRQPPTAGAKVGWDWEVVNATGSWETRKTELGCDGSHGAYTTVHWCSTGEQECIDYLAGLTADTLCGSGNCCVETFRDSHRRVVYNNEEADTCCNWVGGGDSPTYLRGNEGICCP